MSVNKLSLFQVISILAVLVIAVSTWYFFSTVNNKLTWNVVHVSGENMSGDAHVIEMPDGSIILIDTGFKQYAERDLIPFLRKRGIKQIDLLVITHAHRNHYGGLMSIINSGIRPRKVYFNLPPKKFCDKENWAMGCNYQHVLDTRKLIEQERIPLEFITSGHVIYTDPEHDISLTALYVLGEENSPVKNVNVNDASAVIKLVYADQSVLFPGDIGTKAGSYLARHGKDLNATILSAPHHGVEDSAPNSFFDRVSPEVIIASVSKPPYFGNRGKRFRDYVSEHQIRTYVTGVHGRVEVIFDRKSYVIEPEYDVD